MQCQYCAKQILIGSRMTGDADFCSPRHRQKFHQGLATALRRIQDEASPKPTGQPGFYEQNSIFNRAPRSMSCAPLAPARHRSASLPSFGVAAVKADVLHHSVLQNEALMDAEMPVTQEETVVTIQQAQPASRLERISSILSEIRGDIAKRRRDTSDFFGQRGPAPVIQLQPAV